MAESDIYNAKRQAIEKKRAERKAQAAAKWSDSVETHNKGRTGKADGLWAFFGLIFGTPVGWIAGLVFLCVGVAVSDKLAFLGAAGFVALFVVGGILISNATNKKANKGVRSANTARQRAEAQVDEDYQKEIAQLDKWYADFQQQVKAQAVQYVTSAEVPRLAEMLANVYANWIDSALMDTSVKMVNVKLDYRVEQERIWFQGNGVINFAEERINPLTSDVQCVALGETLSQYILQLIGRKYPQGEVTTTHNDAKYTMTYAGLNLNYVPNKTM